MLQRPGGKPRARNSSASQAGAPGARASNGLSSDGALAIRQRIRAPLKFAVPPSRTSQHGTPERSDATASRRVAVKSSARGSPQISPITEERPVHLTPSSIVHSASRASRASTWMRLDAGRPGGWIRPDSRIAIRSWTHRTGLAVSICASRNPAQPPSRGCAAKSSERVGLDGAGKLQYPCEGRGPGARSARDAPARAGTGWTPAFAGALGRAETAPPATRDRPLATRLTTLLFYFCSFFATHGQESMARLGSRPRTDLFRHPPTRRDRQGTDSCNGPSRNASPPSPRHHDPRSALVRSPWR